MYRQARFFSTISLRVVVSLALSGTLRADSPRPRSVSLQDNVRHLPRSVTDPKTSTVLNLPGYALDYPQIIGDWAVCALWHGQSSGFHVPPTPQIRPTRPALVAVNLSDGRTVQLSAADDGSADIDGLLPIGAGQCGVVISRSRVPNGKQERDDGSLPLEVDPRERRNCRRRPLDTRKITRARRGFSSLRNRHCRRGDRQRRNYPTARHHEQEGDGVLL